jgi:hypothetical protein
MLLQPDTCTGSVRATILTGRWIDECADSHPFCSLQGEEGPLPTRLLDLYPAGKVDHVALVNGESIATKPYAPFYVTLSHRWGKHPPIQTTKASEDYHRAGIRISSLPQTFQDAVKVAQAHLYRTCGSIRCVLSRTRKSTRAQNSQQWEVTTTMPTSISLQTRRRTAASVFSLLVTAPRSNCSRRKHALRGSDSSLPGRLLDA